MHVEPPGHVPQSRSMPQPSVCMPHSRLCSSQVIASQAHVSPSRTAGGSQAKSHSPMSLQLATPRGGVGQVSPQPFRQPFSGSFAMSSTHPAPQRCCPSGHENSPVSGAPVSAGASAVPVSGMAESRMPTVASSPQAVAANTVKRKKARRCIDAIVLDPGRATVSRLAPAHGSCCRTSSNITSEVSASTKRTRMVSARGSSSRKVATCVRPWPKTN